MSFPSNKRITHALAEKFTPFVTGMSVKMSTRYGFSRQDREDLVSHCFFKLCKVDWRSKLQADEDWIRSHFRGITRFQLTHVLSILNGYAHTLLQNSMRDEARRIKSFGLTGLLGHKLNELPFEVDDPLPELGFDGNEMRAAGREIAQLAAQILSAEEWLLIQLQFGMDGGGMRTMEQTAKAAGMPRSQVSQSLESAMGKLKERICGDLRDMDGQSGDRRDAPRPLAKVRSLSRANQATGL